MNALPATASLLTAPARGGIAVIVLTGPGARGILEELFRPRAAAAQPGGLSLGWIVDGEEVLDEAIVAVAPAGEWAEINIHGGPQVARRVLTLLAARGAEIAPGDAADPVVAVEYPGLGNPAIAQEMLWALRLALTPLGAAAVTAQWSGGVSSLARSRQLRPARLRDAAGALAPMKRLLCPAEVVVAGPPNVGKSALANAMVGRKVSIVSDTPGTTRDWVRSLAEADGVPIWLTDTAGLWERAEGIDLEAVRRAWGRIESADLILCVTAGPTKPEYRGLLARLRAQANVLNVSAKCDVAAPDGGSELAVSALTSSGIDALGAAIRGRLGFAEFDPSAPMAFTDRQARLLVAAADAADRGDAGRARTALHDLLAGQANHAQR